MPDNLDYLEEEIEIRLYAYELKVHNPKMTWKEAIEAAKRIKKAAEKLQGSVSLNNIDAGNLSLNLESKNNE